MKKLLTIAFALMLGASLSFAQATSGGNTSTDKPATGEKTTKTENTKSGKKGHKGGKKSKKNSGSNPATPPPK
ncbi:MAG TPA: hypothetical protein VKH81_09615 [Candidatus Angelobacter sp.]|nr:hypothetical protein [Candidatus Angelobacter sp.]